MSLGNQPDLQLDRVSVALNLPAFDEDFAGVRAQQSRNDGDSSSFSGAVRPQQPDGLSTIRLKTNAGNGNQFSIALRNPLSLQAWLKCTTVIFRVDHSISVLFRSDIVQTAHRCSGFFLTGCSRSKMQ